MKILVTIPHFFKAGYDPDYGSSGAREQRAATVSRAIDQVFFSFGGAVSGRVEGGRRGVVPVNDNRGNDTRSNEIAVVLCTDEKNFIDGLADNNRVRQRRFDVDPRFLGFLCHRVLRSGLEVFDCFVYLEDDLVVHDSGFLDKILWFNRTFSDRAILLPNRFERARSNRPPRKLYIDGAPSVDVCAGIEQPGDFKSSLSLSHCGRDVRFRRPRNPHAGCFVLTRAQLAHWVAQEHFGRIEDRFVDYLESAATLGIMRTFNVFKTDWPDADFLEIEHGDPRYPRPTDGVDDPLRKWLEAR